MLALMLEKLQESTICQLLSIITQGGHCAVVSGTILMR